MSDVEKPTHDQKADVNTFGDQTESISQNLIISSKVESNINYINQVFPLSQDQVFKYLFASTLINDAYFTRVQIPYKEDERSIKFYKLYYNAGLQSFYYIFSIINMALVLFEEPKFFDFHVPIVFITVINLICLAYFFTRWLHHFIVSDRKAFLNKKLNILTPIILCIMVIDVGIYTVLKALKFTYTIQFSRCLRPLLLLTYPENFKIRSALQNIWVTAVDISTVFALFVFMLAFSAIVSFQFFKRLNITLPDGTKYFGDFLESIYQLYVLVTTSNSPNVIIPAYETNLFYILIYIFVTIICNWILMGIVIASVYNAYKTHLGKYVIRNLVAKKEKLKKAFNLLKDDRGEINITTFVTIMQYVAPSNSIERNKLLFQLISKKNSNKLKLSEFSKLTEYIHLNFNEVPMNRQHFKRYIPRCYSCFMSPINQFFVKLIRHRISRIIFEILIICNGFTIVIFDDTPYELFFEWFFTIIFSIEIILQIFATGINIYVRNYWNIFDMVVISLALFSLILEMIVSYLHVPFSNFYLDFLLALRVLRILKLISIIREFRTIMNCILMLIPSLSYYTVVQIFIYYIYTCIGMEVFSNLYRPPYKNIYETTQENRTTNCGNKNLQGSDFVNSHFCIFNFNNAFNGFLLMLILTVSNNWDILLTGTSLIVGKAARLFFISIHIICVLLVMNIVLAFIIDAYLMEIESSKGKYEKFIEDRLRELNLSVAEEVRKLGIENFGTEKFDLSYEILNKAFPRVSNTESSPENSRVCFALAEGVPKSLDALLLRMFHDDIEQAHKEFDKYNYVVTVIPHSFMSTVQSTLSFSFSKEQNLAEKSKSNANDTIGKNFKAI